MVATEVQDKVALLGGIGEIGDLATNALLREITGGLEVQLAKLTQARLSVPTRVSRILEECVMSIDDRSMDHELAGELCIADRRLLILRLASSVSGDDFWIHPDCSHCSSRFDVSMSRSKLPTKPAGPTFPHAEVALRDEPVALRVPNGADQERIAELGRDAAGRELVWRCIRSVSGRPPDRSFVESLTLEEIESIGVALDDAAPDVGTILEVECPDCETEQLVEIDPYQLPFAGSTTIYEEVHTLAWNYHWNEDEVLRLPRERRQFYLRWIQREKGVSS